MIRLCRQMIHVGRLRRHPESDGDSRLVEMVVEAACVQWHPLGFWTCHLPNMVTGYTFLFLKSHISLLLGSY